MGLRFRPDRARRLGSRVSIGLRLLATPSRGARRSMVLVVASLSLLVVGAATYGQWRYREGRYPARFAPDAMPDGDFTFCRIMYDSVRREPMGMGWTTDYPFAEINVMTRLSELTKTRISRDSSGQPNHWVVRLTDDALFNCPFTMASDVGTIGLTPVEADRLRQYLLKGGFLWVDDFWGTEAWEQWEGEIAKVLPPAEYPIVDVRPDDPIFKSQFNVAG